MSVLKSRRRVFALPFVVTAAVFPTGCVVKSAPPPAAPQTGTTGEAPPADPNVTAAPPSDPNAAGAQPATPLANPPPLDPNAKPADGKDGALPAPVGTANEVKPAERPRVIANPPPLPDAPPGSKLETRADGTCWYYIPVECPPRATCNPPPPRQVKCDAPAKAK